MNYDKYFDTGKLDKPKLTEFNSNNTKILNVEEVKALLLKQEYVQQELAAQ